LSQQRPARPAVLVYLLIGLVLVALVSVLLGGAGWVRVVRLLVLYGGVFLLALYVLGRWRRGR
jgi:hypothetical protein